MRMRVLLTLFLLTLQLRPVAAAAACLVDVSGSAQAACSQSTAHHPRGYSHDGGSALYQEQYDDPAQPGCALASWCATTPPLVVASTTTPQATPNLHQSA